MQQHLSIKDIPGFPQYHADIYGNIFSSKRSGYVNTLAQSFDKDGYRITYLYDGKKKKRRVHTLVALAHVGGRTRTKCEVNHIDGDRANNAASNLEWVSRGRNMKIMWEKRRSKK